MPPDLRSNSDKPESLINFIKSAEFSELITTIVVNETSKLRQEISDLKNQVDTLKESNIQLIHLLVNNNDSTNRWKNEKQNKRQELPISFSDIVKKVPKTDELKKPMENKSIKQSEGTSVKDNERKNHDIITNNNQWKRVKKSKKNTRKLNLLYAAQLHLQWKLREPFNFLIFMFTASKQI